MDMRSRERASRPNHQPLSAHLDVSASIESGPLEKHTHTTSGETRLSISCASSRPPRLAVGTAVDCSDSASPLTLPPRPRPGARKQPGSNPLAVGSIEIKACSGSNQSATDPLHTNSNEIKVPSGVAAGAAFSVEKNKAAFLFFHPFMGAPGNRASNSSQPDCCFCNRSYRNVTATKVCFSQQRRGLLPMLSNLHSFFLGLPFLIKQTYKAPKLPVSNPLASGLSSLESRRLAAPTQAASVPLTVKPFEINGSSGPTAWRPFFVKERVKLPPLVPCFFTPSRRHGERMAAVPRR